MYTLCVHRAHTGVEQRDKGTSIFERRRTIDEQRTKRERERECTKVSRFLSDSKFIQIDSHLDCVCDPHTKKYI